MQELLKRILQLENRLLLTEQQMLKIKQQLTAFYLKQKLQENKDKNEHGRKEKKVCD